MSDLGFSTLVVDQSKNGVKVLVTRFYDIKGFSGSTVEASCACFGTKFRTHSNEACANRVRR